MDAIVTACSEQRLGIQPMNGEVFLILEIVDRGDAERFLKPCDVFFAQILTDEEVAEQLGDGRASVAFGACDTIRSFGPPIHVVALPPAADHIVASARRLENGFGTTCLATFADLISVGGECAGLERQDRAVTSGPSIH